MASAAANNNSYLHVSLCDFKNLSFAADWPEDANLAILTMRHEDINKIFAAAPADKEKKEKLEQSLTRFFSKDCRDCDTSRKIDDAITKLNKEIEGIGHLTFQSHFSIFACNHTACAGGECVRVRQLSDPGHNPDVKTQAEQKLTQMNTILVLFFGAPKKCHKIEFFLPWEQVLPAGATAPVAAGLPNGGMICFYNAALQALNSLFKALNYAPQQQTHVPLYLAADMLKHGVITGQSENAGLAGALAGLNFSQIDFSKTDCEDKVTQILRKLATDDNGGPDLKLLAQPVSGYFKLQLATGQLFETLNRYPQASAREVKTAQNELHSSFERYNLCMGLATLQREQNGFLSSTGFSTRHKIVRQGDAKDIFFSLLDATGLGVAPGYCFRQQCVRQLKVYKKGQASDTRDCKLIDWPADHSGGNEAPVQKQIKLNVAFDNNVSEDELTLDDYLKSLLKEDITDEDNSQIFFIRKNAPVQSESAFYPAEDDETGVVLGRSKLLPVSTSVPDCLCIELQPFGADFQTISTYRTKLNRQTRNISRSAVTLMNAVRRNLVVNVPIRGSDPEESGSDFTGYKIRSVICRSGKNQSSGHYTHLEFTEDDKAVYINDANVSFVGNTSEQNELLSWVFNNNITPVLFILRRIKPEPAAAISAKTSPVT